jgi:hypothetical protein
MVMGSLSIPHEINKIKFFGEGLRETFWRESQLIFILYRDANFFGGGRVPSQNLYVDPPMPKHLILNLTRLNSFTTLYTNTEIPYMYHFFFFLMKTLHVSQLLRYFFFFFLIIYFYVTFNVSICVFSHSLPIRDPHHIINYHTLHS